MGIDDIIAGKQWINTLNSAIETRGYDYLGEIISQMNDYIEDTIKEVEKGKETSSKGDIANRFVRKRLYEHAEKIKATLKDIEYIYSEVDQSLKKITSNPSRYSTETFDFIDNYFGQILNNLGLIALQSFSGIVKCRKDYRTMLGPF
jgi:hypothetical protein